MKHITQTIILIMVFIYSAKAQNKDSTAYKVDLKEFEIVTSPIEKSNLTTEFYKTNTFSSIDNVIERLPGISMIKRGSYALEPVIRGMSAGQVNLTIDGMHIFGACTDKMDPISSYVEPNNLKSISVQHGSNNTLLGSSIAGGMDFKLNDAIVNDSVLVRGSVGGGYQTNGNVKNILSNLNFSQAKWAIRVNGIYRKADVYTNGKGEKVKYTQYEKYNYAISAKYNVTDNDILKIDYIEDEGRDIGYPALPMDVKTAKAQIGSISYQKLNWFDWLPKIETKLYANKIVHIMDDSKRPDSEVPIRMDMPGESETQGGYINLFLKYNEKHHAQARIDYYQNYSWADMTMYPKNAAEMYMLTWPNVQRNVPGLAYNHTFQINELNTLKFNSRLEYAQSYIITLLGKQHFNVFGYKDEQLNTTFFTKNAGISYERQLTKEISSTFVYNYAERLPTISEQFGFYLFNKFDGFDYIGKPDILTEKANNFELKFRYTNCHLDFQANVFTYLFKDYIFGGVIPGLSSMTIGARGVKMYENLPSALLAGGEMVFNTTLWQYFQINSSVKYTYAEDNAKHPLPLIPPLKQNTAIRFKQKDYYLQTEIDWAANQNRVNQLAQEAKTKAYALVNFRAMKAFEFGRNELQCSAAVENIFDTYYREHLDWGNIYRPGRNFVLSAILNF